MYDFGEVVQPFKVCRHYQTLPDIDEHLIFEAFEFLENEKNATMFIAMNANLRSIWLRTIALNIFPFSLRYVHEHLYFTDVYFTCSVTFTYNGKLV